MAENAHEIPVDVAHIVPPIGIARELLVVFGVDSSVVLARHPVAGPTDVQPGDESAVRGAKVPIELWARQASTHEHEAQR